MSLSAVLQRQPNWLVHTESLLLVGLIGWVDYITGWEWSLFVFYALPIVLVVWKGGRRPGFFFALLCAAVWTVAQLDGHPYHTAWGFALAAASRLFYFAVLVVAVGAARAQRELDQREIATLQRSQELEREILSASEREQQRIGRDLHDSLGPHLAAIGYAATFLANELKARAQPETGKAEQICELVGEAVSLTRNLSRGLIPVKMDGSGLAIALEELAATTSRLTGMSVTFYETGDPLVADPNDATHLYRIAQEALNNAAKHGEAKSVTIVLSKSERFLSMVIADDGKGMSADPNRDRGIGLHSMSYRARALGGQIEIKSAPSEGTTVSCEIPLPAARTTATRP